MLYAKHIAAKRIIYILIVSKRWRFLNCNNAQLICVGQIGLVEQISNKADIKRVYIFLYILYIINKYNILLSIEISTSFSKKI